MRLIDADKITFFNCLAKTGSAVCCHAEGIVSKSAIEMQPTVRAIPIEWIEKRIEKLESEPLFFITDYEPVILEDLIADWGKENEQV